MITAVVVCTWSAGAFAATAATLHRGYRPGPLALYVAVMASWAGLAFILWTTGHRCEWAGRLMRELIESDRPRSGYDLACRARVPSWFAYSQLRRLKDDGRVIDIWTSDAHPQRLYRLTKEGVA